MQHERGFSRPGKFRNSLKVIAGGVCRGLGGQSRPIRNLSRGRGTEDHSSDSSTDDIKVASKERAQRGEGKESKDLGRPRKGLKEQAATVSIDNDLNTECEHVKSDSDPESDHSPPLFEKKNEVRKSNNRLDISNIETIRENSKNVDANIPELGKISSSDGSSDQNDC